MVEGWMKMRGAFKNWFLRWFVLRPGKLIYYKDEFDKNCQVSFYYYCYYYYKQHMIVLSIINYLLFYYRHYLLMTIMIICYMIKVFMIIVYFAYDFHLLLFS